jgi:structural maintenance of chromosome 3 (chondroitin sulfate proteoglycan 6)
MISKLKFDRTYSLAFEQIFARTIICADLQVATQYTRSHGLDAVTDEGDRVDRKGPITGGFHDMRRSRLDTIRKVKRWREAYDTDTGRLQEVKESALAVDQQITQIMGEIQKLQARSKAIVENRDHASRQLNWTVREEERARHRLARLEGALIDDEAGLRSAITQRTALEEELQTPLTQQLTPAEVQQLETLTKNAEDEKNAWVEAAQARQKVSSAVTWKLT